MFSMLQERQLQHNNVYLTKAIYLPGIIIFSQFHICVPVAGT